MSIVKNTLVVLVLLLVASGAFAQQAEPSAVKLAFVDVERAAALTDEGKIRLRELQDWAKPHEEELARLGRDINQLQTDIASKRGVASEEALEAMNKTLVSKQREFEDRQRTARREFDEKQTTVLRELGGRLQEVISRYGDSNRMTAILMLKPDYVAYIANVADITESIIKLYNERFPVGKPAAAAPAAPAAPTKPAGGGK
jgi:outer membrane protein